MIEPVDVPPTRSNQSPRAMCLPCRSRSISSIRSRNATVMAPRTPPPSSVSIRLGPAPNRCLSRSRVTVFGSATDQILCGDPAQPVFRHKTPNHARTYHTMANWFSETRRQVLPAEWTEKRQVIPCRSGGDYAILENLALEWKMRCLFVADLHYSLPQFD